MPSAPGGPSDILARIPASTVSARLDGRATVAGNRTCAAGSLGAELVARSSPDGSAVLLTDADALATARRSTRGCPSVRCAASRP